MCACTPMSAARGRGDRCGRTALGPPWPPGACAPTWRKGGWNCWAKCGERWRRARAAAGILLTAAAASFCGNAWTLALDREQPIEMEAETGELDDRARKSVYRGNVVIRQGSLRLTGDTMTVTYTEDRRLQQAIVEGQPATYRQRPEHADGYDKARASRIEYYPQKGRVVLSGEVVVEQQNIEFRGGWVEYDTVNSRVLARGDRAGDDKVRVTIEPSALEETAE